MTRGSVGLIASACFFFLHLKHKLDLEVLHALAGRVDQIDQHVRHFDIGRRFRRRHLRVHVLAVMSQEKEPGRPATDDGKDRDRGDDQFELAPGRDDFRNFRGAIRLIIVCHRPPGPVWK